MLLHATACSFESGGFYTEEARQNSEELAVLYVEGLQQTNLKLKLWGTVTGNKEEAYAVIEESGKRQQNLYRVGDSIQNATVKLILREKIVLSVNGKDEILDIEKAVSRGRKAAIASKTASGARRAGTAQRPLRAQKITLRRSQIETALQDESTSEPG